MPPKHKFTQQEIVHAAVGIVQQSGAEALTARAVADALHASTKVIFGLFANMDALRQAVIVEAEARYHAFCRTQIEQSAYPPYKASGMAYIRFAQQHTQLFRLLFMRDRTGEPPLQDADFDDMASHLTALYGCSREQARLLHLEMWVCVHGAAALQATGFQPLPTELLSRILTDTFRGVCAEVLKEES